MSSTISFTMRVTPEELAKLNDLQVSLGCATRAATISQVIETYHSQQMRLDSLSQKITDISKKEIDLNNKEKRLVRLAKEILFNE